MHQYAPHIYEMGIQGLKYTNLSCIISGHSMNKKVEMNLHDLQRNSRLLQEYRVTGQSIKAQGVRRANYK
jgi:hypothetical protein